MRSAGNRLWLVSRISCFISYTWIDFVQLGQGLTNDCHFPPLSQEEIQNEQEEQQPPLKSTGPEICTLDGRQPHSVPIFLLVVSTFYK